MKLHILDSSGDTEIEYDVAKPETVELAKERFAKELLGGSLAYRVDGEQKTLIKEFDVTAPAIVIVPYPVGG